MTFPKYKAIHEAGHAVIAVTLGGYAEYLTLHPDDERAGGCYVSWPEDGVDRTQFKLLTAAAGSAATAIYTRKGLAMEILHTGLADWRFMKSLGDDSDDWFTRARSLCRQRWPLILAVAEAARVDGFLDEREIITAMEGIQ